MKLEQNLDKNLEFFKSKLKSDDVTFLNLNVGSSKAFLIFVNDIVNKEELGHLILRPIARYQGQVTEKKLFDLFLSPEKTKINQFEDCLK